MRKLIMWNIMTLDGYFEDNQNWDLSFHKVVLSLVSAQQLLTSGVVLKYIK